jgi:hypothetical protein
MLEKTFENILAKYPGLIEENLILVGRQVSMYGRRMDLLFEDRVGRKLVAELKSGPIKDAHIGQILSYEGMLLSADNPTIRVMLIGNRVPPNLRKALDHHGIAWKEITLSQIRNHLSHQDDHEFDHELYDGIFVTHKNRATGIVERLDNQSKRPTAPMGQRQGFWEGFARFRQGTDYPYPYYFGKPGDQNWCDVTRIHDFSGVRIALVIVPTKSEIKCQLYIPDNKDLYEKLFNERSRIDEELGAKIRWYSSPDGYKCSYI